MANITGTAGADTLDGTSGDDLIAGLAGNDMIDSGAGDDVINGGDDNDHIDGGDGSDVIHGGAGDDFITNSAADSSSAESGDDQIFGEGGNDAINYYLTTNRADTLLFDGGDGNDTISFSAWYHVQSLTIAGGDGDDFIFVGGGGSLTVDAGAGDDRVDFYYSDERSAVTLTLGAGADKVILRALGPTSAEVEHAVRITDFVAGAPGDRIWLEDFLSLLTNWDKATNPFTTGHFTLVQRDADAVLRVDYDGGGGGFEDLIIFENVSAAVLTGYNLGITASGGATSLPQDGTAGADYMLGADGGELLRGLDGNDEIEGGLGHDQIEGGIGDDRLNGGYGDDVVHGGDGNDSLNELYSGNDQLFGDAGHDEIRIERTSLPTAVTVLLDGGAGNDRLYYEASGSVARDTVTLIGGDGNDSISTYRILNATIQAGAGDDAVIIRTGSTYLVSLGTGADLVYFYSGHAPGGSATISDYETGPTGDRLEIDNYLEDALIGWDPQTNPYETGHLQLIQRGADSVLQIDRDGAAAAQGFVDLITFSNTTASTFTSLNLGGYSTIRGTEAGERLEGDAGRNGIYGFGGDDELIGFEEDDTLFGGSGNDVMDGGSGEDLLDGGTGADVMSGGYHFDIYIVDDIGDQVIESADVFPIYLEYGDGDEVRSSVATYTIPDHVERLIGTSTTGQTLIGCAGNEVIQAGAGNDFIHLLDGRNYGSGGAGDDQIFGGADVDTLAGGAGSDVIEGGDGDDFLTGMATGVFDLGDDHLDGGAGNDWMIGNRGDDVLIGGTGDDLLWDDKWGADLLDGGEGNDEFELTRFQTAPATSVTLLGGTGNDSFTFVLDNAGTVSVDAGDGDDSFLFYRNNGLVSVTLGAGRDAIAFSDFLPTIDPAGQIAVTDFVPGASGDEVDLTAFLTAWTTNWNPATNPFVTGHARVVQSGSSAQLQLDRDGGGNSFVTALTFQNGDAFAFTAENLDGLAPGNSSQSGTGGNDTLDGAWGSNRLLGLGGDDLLRGLAGEDRLDGDAGNDVLRGGTGADVLIGGTGIDTADYAGEFGAVSVSLATGAGRFNAAEGDTLAGIENIAGTDYGDILTGSAGANRLNGHGGNDTIMGGAGADQLLGGAGNDTADYRDNFGAVSVNLATGVGRFNFAEGDTLADFENVAGTDSGDILTGSSAANILFGHGGNDTIAGGAGSDALDGAAGTDTLSYAGNFGGVWADLEGGFGRWNYAEGDILSGFENLIGTSFADILRGNFDNNRLSGGEGADQLFGMAGNDLLAGGTGADSLDGGFNVDTADYSGEFGAISINLATGIGRWNAAEGDTLTSIEKVIGTSFGDLFEGNNAANVFTGGAGNDTFLFKAGFSHDAIGDFQGNGAAAGDTIRFAAGLFADFADLMSKSSQQGGDVVIALNSANMLTLQNTQLADLHSSDFIFG